MKYLILEGSIDGDAWIMINEVPMSSQFLPLPIDVELYKFIRYREVEKEEYGEEGGIKDAKRII